MNKLILIITSIILSNFWICCAASFTYAGEPDNEFFYYAPNPTYSAIVGSQFVYYGETSYVNRLGIWDSGKDGLVHSHEVGLWELISLNPDESVLITSVVIPASSPSDDSGYAWSKVNGSILLQTGHRYVLGAVYPIYASIKPYDFFSTSVPIFNNFKWEKDRFLTFADSTPTLKFPTDSWENFDSSWFGPNIELIPESDKHSLIIGIGLIFLGIYCSKRQNGEKAGT